MRSKSFKIVIKTTNKSKSKSEVLKLYHLMLKALKRLNKTNDDTIKEYRKFESSRLKGLIDDLDKSENIMVLTINDKLIKKYKVYDRIKGVREVRINGRSDKLAYFKRLKELALDEIRAAREAAKAVRLTTAVYTRSDKFQLPSITTRKQGTILNLLKERKLSCLEDAKKPNSDRPHIAVEIECLIPRDKELDFKESILPLNDFVQVKRDGSINEISGYKGIEIALVGPKDDFSRLLKSLCINLSNAGAKVNKSCGLHVHLDGRKSDPKRLYYNLVQSLPLLKSMVSKSRLANQYCKINKNKNVMNHRSRYYAINGLAYSRYKTIEVRLHNGTTDFDKINNWVTILSAIAYNKKTILRWPKKLSTLKTVFGFSDELITYIDNRQKTFCNSSNVSGDSEVVSEAA